MRTRLIRTFAGVLFAGCVFVMTTTPAGAGHPVVGGCHMLTLKGTPISPTGASCKFVTLGGPSSVRCEDIPPTQNRCKIQIVQPWDGFPVCTAEGPKPVFAGCPPLPPGQSYLCVATWEKPQIALKDAECTG